MKMEWTHFAVVRDAEGVRLHTEPARLDENLLLVHQVVRWRYPAECLIPCFGIGDENQQRNQKPKNFCTHFAIQTEQVPFNENSIFSFDFK